MNNLIHHKIYFNLAKQNLTLALSHESSMKVWFNEKSPWTKQDSIDEIYVKTLGASIISIVFSALTVESFINYYGISRLSKNQFDNYLGKLDLYAKWIVVPKFITGRSIDTDCQAFSLLKNLIRSRNNLVHYKSSGNNPNEFYDNLSLIKNSDTSEGHLLFIKEAANGVQAIIKLIEEIIKIDNSITPEEIDWDEDINRWFEMLSV